MKGCWGQVCKHRAICRVSWVGTCSRVIYRSRCFLLIYILCFFFSAEIVTLLRKCMQLVIKRVLCLLMLLTAEKSLKVVVSILLKNTERMEAKILNTCINQSCLQKVTTHKHNEAQKAGFKTEWFCSEICHFFLNMGDWKYHTDYNVFLFIAINIYGERSPSETK